jgi:hypothetical protein
MPENRVGDYGTKFSDLFFASLFVAEFNGLEFQKILDSRIHKPNQLSLHIAPIHARVNLTCCLLRVSNEIGKTNDKIAVEWR